MLKINSVIYNDVRVFIDYIEIFEELKVVRFLCPREYLQFLSRA